MRRVCAALAAVALLAAGCTGGGGGKDADETYQLPLPKKAPSAAGPVSGPAMEPQVLLAASDDLEEQAGDIDRSQVDRRAGTFLSGRTVVGYSVDDISGYDLDSGEQLWTAKLDLGSGTVCFVSQPDRSVKQFTVVYGESGYCPNVATIKVSNGKVVKKSTALTDRSEFEGERAGGSVNELFTVKGKDYLVDMSGVVWLMKGGEPEPIKRLATDRYFNLYPTPEGDRLIGTRSGGACEVDAYSLPSFELEWTKTNDDLFPDAKEDCVTTAAKGNPSWLLQQDSNKYLMVQLDPATGKVLGSTSGPTSPPAKPIPSDQFNLASAANQFDRAWGLPGGDMVFTQVGGMVRYSLKDKKVDWALNLSQTELESDEEYPLTTVLPSGVTPDGYLISSVSNDTSVEIDAVNVKTGKLAARWGLPEEYRNGFQVEPGVTVYDDGIIMARNFEQWEFTFADYQDLKEPEGDMYDFGVFAFPEPDNKKSSKVPTAGPANDEATALKSIKTPKAEDYAPVGTIYAGSRVVAYSAGTVYGLDPKSGKQSWKTALPDDQMVCSFPEPDRKVKVITIGLGTQGACKTVVRMSTASGKILDTATLPGSGKTAALSDIQTYRGKAYIVARDGKVYRWKGGQLTAHADLGLTPYLFSSTPVDDSLLISAREIKGGKDWEVTAFRLPAYEKVWTTTAKKAFGDFDPANFLSVWRGNALLLSTTYGDVNDTEAKIDDAIVALDPSTGKVAYKTGKVRRDYLQKDLKKLNVSSANLSGYVSAGFDNGDVIVEQPEGLIRFTPEGKTLWAVNTKSIQNSMERTDEAGYTSTTFDIVDDGKTVLSTMTNSTSVEFMTVSAKDGKITGRWTVPAASRNGFQDSPDVLAYGDTVVLSRSGTDKKVDQPEQTGTLLDVGMFTLD